MTEHPPPPWLPQVGAPWDLTDDEAGRLMEAIRTRRDTVPAGWLLRPGGHCAAKGGLTTLWAYTPNEDPDGQGRRPSDVNVGTVLGPVLAADLCEAFNGRQARSGYVAELEAWIAHDPDVINADTLADFIAGWGT